MSNNRFRFNKMPYKTVEVGEWRFEWYYNEKRLRDCRLKITAKNGTFELCVSGASHAYGYLLAAAEQGMLEQLHGYIAMLYASASILTQDQGFVDGMNKEIGKWFKRQEKKAETAAKGVSDATEQANQALMEDLAEESGLSKKEMKAKRDADKRLMKEILDEENTDNG